MSLKKKDLRDGMVVEYKNGTTRVVRNGNELCDENGLVCGKLNYYDDDLKAKNRNFEALDICKVMLDGKVVPDIETLYMTVEDMRIELEWFLGKKIEVIPSREEKIEKLDNYCSEHEDCEGCTFLNDQELPCYIANLENFNNDTLDKYYKEMVEDERKEHF